MKTLEPVIIGLVSAIVVVFVKYLWGFVSDFGVWLMLPLFVTIAAIHIFLRKKGNVAQGFSELFYHIYSPASPDSPWRWLIRGMSSLIFGALRAFVGPEGAAMELSHALALKMKARVSNWFQLQRRTDAAIVLAAGIAAAFNAPFVAVILPLELKLGGRTLSLVIGAISAILGIEAFRILGVDTGMLDLSLRGRAGIYGANILEVFDINLNFILSLGVITVLLVVTGLLAIHWIKFCQRGFRKGMEAFPWGREALGAFLLIIILLLFPAGRSFWDMWPLLTAGDGVPSQTLCVVFLFQFLGLSIVLSFFGTLGVFLPVWFLGVMAGFCFSGLLPIEGAGAFEMGLLVAWVGGCVFWTLFFGSPIAAALLAFYQSGSVGVLVICLLVGVLLEGLRRVFLGQTLMGYELQDQGVVLSKGRVQDVLDSLSVKDVMVTDYIAVNESDTLNFLSKKIIESKYPFLVVNSLGGQYLGLLTADLIQSALRHSKEKTAENSFKELIEARDLLSRAKFKAAVIRGDDSLSNISLLNEKFPCLPVVNEKAEAIGLLFLEYLRIAYDEEIARRSIFHEYRESGKLQLSQITKRK